MSIIVKRPYGGQEATGTLSNGPGLQTVYMVDRFTGETIVYDRNIPTIINITAKQIDQQNLMLLGGATTKIFSAKGVTKVRRDEILNELIVVPELSKTNYQKVDPELRRNDNTYFHISQWSAYVQSLWSRGYYDPWPDSEAEWALLSAAEKQTWVNAQSVHLSDLLVPVYNNYKVGGVNVPFMESPGHVLFTICWWHELYTTNNPRITGYGTTPDGTSADTWAQYLVV